METAEELEAFSSRVCDVRSEEFFSSVSPVSCLEFVKQKKYLVRRDIKAFRSTALGWNR